MVVTSDTKYLIFFYKTTDRPYLHYVKEHFSK